MQHIEVDPVHAEDVTLVEPDAGFPYRVLARRPLTPTSHEIRTSLVYWPDGASRPWGRPDQLEYHTLHEEIVVLAGELRFDRFYSVRAPGYCNHPPFFVHPTNFSAVGELVMLMRTSTPPLVQFDPVPAGFSDTGYFAPGQPTRCHGVSHAAAGELPWAELLVEEVGSGISATRLWEDADDGWTTWLMSVPPGWRAPGPPRRWDGGDEVFVVGGDLRLDLHGEQAALRRHGYLACVEEWRSGGELFGSDSGATFVRWTKTPPGLLALGAPAATPASCSTVS